MRILLIAPASDPWRGIGRARLFGGRAFRFSLLSLLSVAGETPEVDEVAIIDEQIDAIPWNERWDLVGMTVLTSTAPRAYALARRFRARGVPVVLGGVHPTLLPDEASRYADAVVVGEAEGIWGAVVEEARTGRPSGIYRSTSAWECGRSKPLPRHLLRRGDYATLQAVQATRGCPNRCRFCTVSALHGARQTRRSGEEVAAEVASLPERFFIFVDDNLTADRVWAIDLFERLAPLGKRWLMQSTLAVAQDPALLGSAARAGCVGVFAGLESFSGASLGEAGKGFHRAEAYRDSVATLHRSGIGVEAGIVLGFDHDGPDVFERTLRALDRTGVDLVQISILTPMPGTPLFETMRPRLVDRDWSYYDFHHAVHRPARMSPEDLQAGHDWLTREFYRPWRIARRLARHASRPRRLASLIYHGAIEAAYYGRVVRWGLRGAEQASAGCHRRLSRLGPAAQALTGGPTLQTTAVMSSVCGLPRANSRTAR